MIRFNLNDVPYENVLIIKVKREKVFLIREEKRSNFLEITILKMKLENQDIKTHLNNFFLNSYIDFSYHKIMFL